MYCADVYIVIAGRTFLRSHEVCPDDSEGIARSLDNMFLLLTRQDLCKLPGRNL